MFYPRCQVWVKISLNWGLNACGDLLLRGLPLSAVSDDLALLLLAFAAACLLIAWRLVARKR